MLSHSAAAERGKSEICVLVQGPTWGDAEFYGRWLLFAAEAQALLKQAKSDDQAFREAIDSLEILAPLCFGLMATVFVSQFADKKFETFTIEFGSDDMIEFAIMVEMGFFALCGDHYQMILPPTLDINTVKKAHIKLARTDDHDGIHPEWLVLGMPYAEAARQQDQQLARLFLR
jgi:hypothetical protein